MKLGDFRNVNFEQFMEFEIEDAGFLHTMMFRMIEDTEIAIYVVAKSKGEEFIQEETVSEALKLLEPSLVDATETQGEITFKNTPTEAIVTPVMVQDFARAPLPHNKQAFALLSKFVNFHLINMLHAAAGQANNEDLQIIKLRHYLPWCEEWPWPLNRYC